MSICKKCGKTLESDEIAIYRRMLQKDAEESDCLCKKCLAAFFAVPESAIDEKIRYFKETGCTLFKM